MYVCICKQVTEQQIQDAINDGVNTVDGIATELGASTDCGSCRDCVKDMITEYYTEYLIPATSIELLNPAQ